jgi:hypothetical protein
MEIMELNGIGDRIAAALTGLDAGARWKLELSGSLHSIRIKNAAVPYEALVIAPPPSKATPRLRISGVYPPIGGMRPYIQGLMVGPINVSATKDAAQAAQDIYRRLLPQYRKDLAAYKDAARAEKAFQDGRIDLARTLNRIMGSEWTPGPNFSMTEGTPVAQLKYPYGPLAPLVNKLTATVQSETSIEIRLDVCTPEVAKTLMSAIMSTLTDLADNQEEPPTEAIPDQSYREAARAAYESEIEIDSNAEVSRGDDDGAFVAAWLWVSNEAAEDARDNNNRDGRA